MHAIASLGAVTKTGAKSGYPTSFGVHTLAVGVQARKHSLLLLSAQLHACCAGDSPTCDRNGAVQKDGHRSDGWWHPPWERVRAKRAGRQVGAVCTAPCFFSPCDIGACKSAEPSFRTTPGCRRTAQGRGGWVPGSAMEVLLAAARRCCAHWQ